MADVAEIIRLLDGLDEKQRREVFAHLRKTVPVHPVEAALNATAEVILEAISRSSDLTIRGIEGIIAEATFAMEIIPTLTGWTSKLVAGDQSYDFLLSDGKGEVNGPSQNAAPRETCTSDGERCPKEQEMAR